MRAVAEDEGDDPFAGRERRADEKAAVLKARNLLLAEVVKHAEGHAPVRAQYERHKRRIIWHIARRARAVRGVCLGREFSFGDVSASDARELEGAHRASRQAVGVQIPRTPLEPEGEWADSARCGAARLAIVVKRQKPALQNGCLKRGDERILRAAPVGEVDAHPVGHVAAQKGAQPAQGLPVVSARLLHGAQRGEQGAFVLLSEQRGFELAARQDGQSTFPPALRIERYARLTQRLCIAVNRAHRNLQPVGQLGGGNAVALKEDIEHFKHAADGHGHASFREGEDAHLAAERAAPLGWMRTPPDGRIARRGAICKA